ncbi:CD9 antigen-like isoform X2 [Onychostoma macrolepis]|uniref:CD9 antigen-like isoform X2 n=1 Tax=Onychostoma macrolepis TaxID=369639 RepID=UPI00272CA544|nr:CD9 antigen-like isoform X2 [Onychostoma macrolepis]
MIHETDLYNFKVLVRLCAGISGNTGAAASDLFSTARGQLLDSADNGNSVKSLFKMDGCAQICRCFLILFNTLFALVGFGLVALGMWLRFGAETRGFFDIDLNTAQFNIGVIVLVVTGVLMLVMAVIGHCGACNNSRSALGVSSGLLSILIIMQIAAGVMAFVRSAQVSIELVGFYISIYLQYLNTRSPAQAVTLKLFNNAFHCCGFNETIEVFVRHTCPGGSFLKQISYSSCPGVISDVFEAHAPLVLGGFLGIAGVTMLVLVCSCVLRRHVSVSHKSPPPYILLGSTLSSVKMI